jgi:hypothetical protein
MLNCFLVLMFKKIIERIKRIVFNAGDQVAGKSQRLRQVTQSHDCNYNYRFPPFVSVDIQHLWAIVN